MSARRSRNLNPDPASSNAALPLHIAAAFDAEAPASSSARDIYGLMKASWAQVCLEICRAYEESRTLSDVDGHDTHGVADFLESRASDCLPDGISSGLGIWQVALAVREHGELQSFPVLLVPQDLCDAVCDPECADNPLPVGAGGREWVPTDSDASKPPLQMRHAFVVHMCDLLVRPFGVVAGTVQYDLEKFRLTYVVDADAVDVESVSSFLRALAQPDNGNRKSRGQPPATSQSGAETTTSTSHSKTGGRNADSSASKAAAMRDAFCPITLGDEGLQAAHLCHPRLGQQIYNWVMQGLATECSLSGRYGLSAWDPISSWDINGPTNLVMVDPRLNIHDAWVLLPRSPSDLHPPHLVFPTDCTVKSTFWNHDDKYPLVEKRYVFINFREKEIGPSLLKWDADIRNLLPGYGNLTGITPVFVEKKKRPREDEVDGDEAVDGDDMVVKRPRKVKPSDEGHIATDTAQPPPSTTTMQSPVRADPSNDVPKPMSSPSLRKLQKPALMRRPTAPETYWPEKSTYPPPIAWDAMSASRFARHFSSLAVRCFAECLGADEVQCLIASLPPSKTAGADARDAASSRGLDDTAPGATGQGDVGTVFLFAVVLLASRYAAADGGGGDDDLLVSGSVERDSTRTTSW